MIFLWFTRQVLIAMIFLPVLMGVSWASNAHTTTRKPQMQHHSWTYSYMFMALQFCTALSESLKALIGTCRSTRTTLRTSFQDSFKLRFRGFGAQTSTRKCSGSNSSFSAASSKIRAIQLNSFANILNGLHGIRTRSKLYRVRLCRIRSFRSSSYIVPMQKLWTTAKLYRGTYMYSERILGKDSAS